MPLTITHAKSDTIADFTGTITQFNSTGGTVTVAATDLVRPSDWNSGHQITLALTGSEIASLFSFQAGMSSSTNASGISAGVNTFQFYEPFFPANTNSTASTMGAGTWYIDPIWLPNGIGSGQLNFLELEGQGFVGGTTYSSASTGSRTISQTVNTQLAIYQMGTGANTTRIESIWSQEVSRLCTWALTVDSITAGGGTTTGCSMVNAVTLSLPSQYDASGGITYGTSSQSGTTSGSTSTLASTRADNIVTGIGAYASGSMLVAVPFATSLPAGEYYLAMMTSSSSTSAGTNYTQGTAFQVGSIVHNLEFVDRAYKVIGKSTSNTSSCILPFHGSVATTSSAPFSSLGTSDMRNFAANNRLYWNYLQTSY